MALKRAKFFSYGKDKLCSDVQQFIENAGVLLDVRDIEKQPLTEAELNRLLGHLNIEHFINKLSPAYKKHRLDKEMPPREEVIQLILKDHTLLRKPIVQSARLITIGCDKKKIADMLQLTMDGEPTEASNNGSKRLNQRASVR